MEVRLIQDFRVHVRERKDPATIYYFRISSYLLLVALTVLTSMVLTLMNYNRRVVLDETGTGQQVHGRVPTHHHKLRPLPQFHVASFRHPHAEEHLSVSKSGHCDRGIEPNTSAVIPDRIAKYKSVVNGEAGDIISDQKIIDDHHSISLFKDSYAYYYDHGIEISEVDTWDGTNVTKLGTTEFVTLTVATQKIATKCLDIADFNVESFRNKNMADFDAWDRKVATVLYNCKRTYRLFGEKLTRDFVQFVLNYADSQRTTYLYIVLASAGAVIFAMLSLIPFIVRAHTSVVKVYQVFVRIKKKEYTDLIGLAEEFLEDSNKQFSAIKKKFNDINFKEAQRLEQEAIELAAKKNNGRAKARRGGQVPELPAVITPENKSLQKDEEEESLKAQEMDKAALTSQLEVMETQRKEQSMSASSSRSRNILLAEIVGIAAMFAIYFLVTILIRVNYFAKTKTTMEIVEVIARRKPLLTAVGLFSKEDFTTGTICYDSDTSTRTDCIIFLVENESLFKYYYWEDLDNELKRESLYDNIEAMFPDLYTVIEELSSSSYCSLIENTTESINSTTRFLIIPLA